MFRSSTSHVQRIQAEQALIEQRLDEVDGINNLQRQLDVIHISLPEDGNVSMDVDGCENSLPIPPHLRHIEMVEALQTEPPLARAIAAKRRAVDHIVCFAIYQSGMYLYTDIMYIGI